MADISEAGDNFAHQPEHVSNSAVPSSGVTPVESPTAQDSKFINRALLHEARTRFPFEQMLTQLGHAPENGKWKSFKCPFCGKKNKCGIFQRENGSTLFKCQSTSCPTSALAMDEIGYLKVFMGQSREDAFVTYCKMAGIWQERERFLQPQSEAPPACSTQLPSAETSELSQAPSEPEVETVRPPKTGGIAAEYGMTEEQSEARIETLPQVIQRTTTMSEAKALQALREFYRALTLSSQDEQRLYDKRGLSSSCIGALGFKSNLRSNAGVLRQLGDHFPHEILYEAGLWVRKRDEGGEPNRQFYGWGNIGKTDTGDELWSWCHPILIPYFNEDGELVHLRPHKGGAKGVSGRIYIPRGGVRTPEKFNRVLITEGEFKAAALWFASRGKYGVVALPGIQMANNYACKEELEDWLRRVGARQVVVVYDNQDKSNEPKWQKRFDAPIWGIVLASRLAENLRIDARAWKLPDQWRDQNGKADWDGALSRHVRQNQQQSNNESEV